MHDMYIHGQVAVPSGESNDLKAFVCDLGTYEDDHMGAYLLPCADRVGRIELLICTYCACCDYISCVALLSLVL
jgi:hypothetical protein